MSLDNAPEDYADVIDPLQDEYGDRCLAILEKMRQALRTEGIYATEPGDWSADTYSWRMMAWTNRYAFMAGHRQDDGDPIDISIEIAEAQEYGDSDEHPYGINFGLDVVEYGGLIVGGLTPYNYTAECWVDAREPDQVEARFSIIENADPYSLVELISEHRAEQARRRIHRG